MRILVAPDKFKGTLTSHQAAAAIAAGARRAVPDADVVELPLADGGDGTIEVIAAHASEFGDVSVTGPLGAPARARAVSVRRAMWIEAADACGLRLVPEPNERSALRASTYGVGEAIAALDERGVAHVVLAVGGSASTDGGAGAARACGWRFVGRDGAELDASPQSLLQLHAIVPPERRLSCRVTAACDVRDPLLGPTGSASRYAPQKGAGPREVQILERALSNLALVVERDVGRDIAGTMHAGAGGGLAGGCHAFFDAELVGGFALVAEIAGLADEVERADLVVTGEGRLDPSTAAGKTPGEVATAARSAGVPCLVVAGEVALSESAIRELGFAAAGQSVATEVDPQSSVASAAERLVVAYLSARRV